MPEWLKYLITFLVGGAGSLFAPWANWRVEKRKLRHEYRQKTLARLKSVVNTFGYDQGIRSCASEYMSVRQYLDRKLVNEIDLNLKSSEPTQKDFRYLLLRDIARLEKRWGLL